MNESWLQSLLQVIRIRLEGRHNLQKVLSNTAWLFADRILRMSIDFYVTAWIARYFGPEEFGLYNYAIAFVALFSAFSTLGLDSIVVRDIIRGPSSKNEILGTVFILKLIGGVVTLLLTFEVISLLRPSDYLTRWLVGITATGTIFRAFDTIDFWFQSQLQSKYTVYAKNVAFLFTIIIKIILIKIQAPLIAFACVGLVEIFLGALGLMLAYRVNGYFIKNWHYSLTRAKSLLKDSWPLFLSGVSVYIYSRIDQIMLGQMANAKSLGIYSVAVKLGESLAFVPMILASSLLPSLVQMHQKDKIFFMKNMQKLFDLLTVFWLFTAIIITFSSSFIVNALFGTAYSNSAAVLSLYIWTQFGCSFNVARGLYININNLFKTSLVISIFGAVLNIFLNYYLIPIYQELGTTFATFITYFIVTIIINFCFKDLKVIAIMIFKSLLFPNAITRILNNK